MKRYPFPTDRPNYMSRKQVRGKASWIRRGLFVSTKGNIGGSALTLMGGMKGIPSTNFNEIDWVNRMGSLISCDEKIGELFDTLKARELWKKTLVFVVSDNGYMLGAHSISQKTVPYEESIAVPFWVLGGALKSQRGKVTDEWVLNIDFGPTFVDIATSGFDRNAVHTLDRGARVKAAEFMKDADGFSLKNLILGEENSFKGRQDALFEYLGSTRTSGKWLKVSFRAAIPYYRALRAQLSEEGGEVWKLIYWEAWKNKVYPPLNYEYELYNLTKDPYEMQNLFLQVATDRKTHRVFKKLLKRTQYLENCSGENCRQ